MAERGRVKVETGPKRVRVMLAGEYVADSYHPLLVWEKPYYPTYYFPAADVDRRVLSPSGETRRSPSRGDAVLYDVTVAGTVASGAAYQHQDSPIEEIRQAIAFDWGAMDHWFEEDEEVFVHPRDPYHRVDILRSSRHVRVEVDGTEVADSLQPTVLFETGLPARYYLPKTDVRMDLLTPTSTATACPYKGNASYWSFGDHSDIVWGYEFPAAESAKIAGLVSFYNEKVDIWLDGELQVRPTTVFS
jgi:uncharacterized protein (DUF427 family)